MAWNSQFYRAKKDSLDKNSIYYKMESYLIFFQMTNEAVGESNTALDAVLDVYKANKESATRNRALLWDGAVRDLLRLANVTASVTENGAISYTVPFDETTHDAETWTGFVFSLKAAMQKCFEGSADIKAALKNLVEFFERVADCDAPCDLRDARKESIAD
jgi:hypothetical protein